MTWGAIFIMSLITLVFGSCCCLILCIAWQEHFAKKKPSKKFRAKRMPASAARH